MYAMDGASLCRGWGSVYSANLGANIRLHSDLPIARNILTLTKQMQKLYFEARCFRLCTESKKKNSNQDLKSDIRQHMG